MKTRFGIARNTMYVEHFGLAPQELGLKQQNNQQDKQKNKCKKLLVAMGNHWDLTQDDEHFEPL